MKNCWIFSIAFLLLCALHMQGAQYKISISFYQATDTSVVNEYYQLEATNDREAISNVYELFTLFVFMFDNDYVTRLYHPKAERDSLLLPVNYFIYSEKGLLELPRQYRIDALYRRLKNDYWGECYREYDSTYLPYPSIIKQNKRKKKSSESKKRSKLTKKNRKNHRFDLPRGLEPVPSL